MSTTPPLREMGDPFSRRKFPLDFDRSSLAAENTFGQKRVIWISASAHLFFVQCTTYRTVCSGSLTGLSLVDPALLHSWLS